MKIIAWIVGIICLPYLLAYEYLSRDVVHVDGGTADSAEGFVLIIAIISAAIQLLLVVAAVIVCLSWIG